MTFRDLKIAAMTIEFGNQVPSANKNFRLLPLPSVISTKSLDVIFFSQGLFWFYRLSTISQGFTIHMQRVNGSIFYSDVEAANCPKASIKQCFCLLIVHNVGIAKIRKFQNGRVLENMPFSEYSWHTSHFQLFLMCIITDFLGAYQIFFGKPCNFLRKQTQSF